MTEKHHIQLDKAQMEMAELVAYWPHVPVIYKSGTIDDQKDT